ncbi:MAG: hypothetical protein ABJF67_21115 [Aurantimonas coralicida]|jgi:hypothetical protein|uniref:hypothetical protein n=1 Tax=Aurantimonadaceae TaxID=255475 RepID=UPI00041AE53C|nr:MULTISPECIES: hypothetical protein [Aurantimonadaceae]MAU97119.1 hypothetical protein [Fulvimarina sp.]MCC4299879.1 hypothetical protein [Aurantimonas coralicida]MCD1643329.1 hypothetical protein [Aurantimonas coralicida]MCQ0989907.1 hypothetical protein [Jiella sp. LLJ827]MDE0924713.1 hypothetical protein [Aurantimonas coralicida]
MNKLTVSIIAPLATSCLAGCATTGSPSGCDGWQAIRPTADDHVRQVLEHNRFGIVRCGWRA